MRTVVNVATCRYVKGQERLTASLARDGENYCVWNDRTGLPLGCPSHQDVPYAFKAFALRQAADTGSTTLLWADASILSIQPLDELWQKIERDGYWIANNGYTNYEWTADSAYPDLFPEVWLEERDGREPHLEHARAINREIPHVVATAFGISLKHPVGSMLLHEYLRLAKTKAFCGPWANDQSSPCGPPDVRGHRHDQTALSVIAWRMGCKLTNCPEWFSYRGGETEGTVLVADGSY